MPAAPRRTVADKKSLRGPSLNGIARHAHFTPLHATRTDLPASIAILFSMCAAAVSGVRGMDEAQADIRERHSMKRLILSVLLIASSTGVLVWSGTAPEARAAGERTVAIVNLQEHGAAGD